MWKVLKSAFMGSPQISLQMFLDSPGYNICTCTLIGVEDHGGVLSCSLNGALPVQREVEWKVVVGGTEGCLIMGLHAYPY